MIEKEPEPEILKEDLLTTQEMIFCEYVASGHSNREAYKKAFPKRAHWSVTTLDPAVSKLYKEPKILRAIAHKSEEFAKTHFMSKQYKRLELKNIFEDSSLPLKDRLKALEIDNKLSPDLEPIKVENSGNMNLTHSVDKSVEQALEKLLG